MKVRARERTAIMQSLKVGVVPRIGLHLIQVGRQREVEALIDDLKRIESGASTIRYVIGRFGSGKSFFLNLIRTVALQRKLIVVQADISLERRFYSSGGHAKALYAELIKNMATRAKPQGGAMPGLVERFVTDVANEMGPDSDFAKLEAGVSERLRPLRKQTYGVHFIRVMAKYVEGFAKSNQKLRDAALRWLCAEYGTKTEAREDLEVRDIIQDSHLYDMLKIWASFVRVCGYDGLFVNLDEMVVLSERLSTSTARAKNYEVLLQILNNCIQGAVEGIGFCFAGTPEFLEDQRRGIASYEALRSRLAGHRYEKDGMVDMSKPVIRLQPLEQEELFVLLEKIALVQASGDATKRLVDSEGIHRFMEDSLKRLGAKAYKTPRDTVKDFVGLLSILEQYPDRTLDDLLGEKAAQPPEPAGDELTNFKL